MAVPSLRVRLTLLTAAVAVAVIALAISATYVEMARADVQEASDRLQRAAPQLAGLFGASVPGLRAVVGAVANDTAVRAFLHNPRGKPPSVLLALRPLQAVTAAVAGVEIWDVHGRRLMAVPDTLAPLSDSSARALISLLGDSASVVGPLSSETSYIHYSVVGRSGGATDTAGYLVLRRKVAASGQAAQPFRDLIGTEVTLLVGNTRGDLWTDFARRTRTPAIASAAVGTVTSYRQPSGAEVMAIASRIPNTPWTLGVELPLAPELADAVAARSQVVKGAILLLLLSVAGSWLLVGTVTRPVAKLVAATEAISAGDYGHRVDTARSDELGALANAFNHMASRLGESRKAIERQSAEITHTENRFRALIENSADGIALIAPDGVVAYQSPGAERISGRATADRLGKTFAMVVHDDDMPAIRAMMSEVKAEAGASRTTEARFKHADGSWHWAEAVFTNLLAEPSVRAIVINYRDVTERKLADEARAESEERFRQVAEHVKEAFYVVDIATGRALYLSPMWSEIWGRPMEDGYDAANRTAGIHPDDRAKAAAIRERLALGESGEVVFRLVRPDGAIRWIRSRAFPVRDKDGKVYRFVGVSDDITEFRLVEERFTRAQKMEAVGRLAGGIAHDFNNLLTVILSYAEALQAPPQPGDDPKVMIQEIHHAGTSAAALTRQLLAFSRKELVEPTVFALNDAVAETTRMLARILGEDVRLETKLDSAAGSVRADRGHIDQLLSNLAVNARDAMPNGGLLSVTTSNARLDDDYVRTHPGVRVDDYVLLTVSDTGSGMTDEVKARVFEPFFTTKPVGKGTGLGLATCHAIVQQSEGHISLYSEPGIGTTFRVYLPRVSANTAAVGSTKAAVAPSGSEVILLVEDHDIVRTVCARILRGLGYEVLETSNATAALTTLESEGGRVRLLLTDVVMPGMGGRELAAQVRQAQPHIKVLFSSGYTDDVILQHQLVDHNASVIRKPYSRAALAEKVRSVLDA